MVEPNDSSDLKKSLKAAAKPACFGNWADNYGYPLTSLILPYAVKIGWLTPNLITILSFIIYSLGSLALFIHFDYHLYLASLFLLIGYIGDQLDGQAARARGLSSRLGNYLDKVLDVVKIYVITISLGTANYLRTGRASWIFLAFTACFFFNLRYYIKLETVLSQAMRDEDYFKDSAAREKELLIQIESERNSLRKSPSGRVKLFLLKNKSIFLVDEAEFAVFTALLAPLDRLDIALIILALSQVLIAVFRSIQRARETSRGDKRLLNPMRK